MAVWGQGVFLDPRTPAEPVQSHLFCSRVKSSCRFLSQKDASRHMSLVSASRADARSTGCAERRFLHHTTLPIEPLHIAPLKGWESDFQERSP